MKRVTTLLVVLGGLTLGVANATSLPTGSNVQTQERVQQMNEMKERMMQMSPEERQVAMGEIQANMPKDMQDKMQEHMQHGQEGMGEGQKEQMREHAGEMRMEHSNEMAQHQNMKQQQAEHQFKTETEKGQHNGENAGGGRKSGGKGKDH